ncbi:MAG TPA: ABC transporter permease subunit [Vicinamibacterales bacterium]|jgi:Cu-processing system permease protein|nr:ABC transporter permease subunit [Vicinamibacterales bacterium]
MTGPLLLCARQELLLAVRSRWTQVFAAVFAALSLGVAASGYILSGGSGVQDFARTAASLVQLVLLLVPLTAIVMGVLTLASDRGAAELLFSQPVPRGVILIGRLLGLLAALASAQAVGFGLAGVVLYARAGSEGVGGFLLIGLASIVLTAIFLALAALVSARHVGGRRVRALAIALVVWFVLVVLFDLAALGLASTLRSGTASRVLILTVLTNPIDAVRAGTLLGVEGTGAFGAGSLALLRFTHGPFGAAVLLSASMLLWIVLPALLAVRRLARLDI